MANCTECGRKLHLFEAGSGGLCTQCARGFERRRELIEAEEVLEQARQREAEAEAIMLTTETYPQGLNIIERVEIVTAECAFGMNIFKDLFSGVRDIVGGRSEAVQKTLRDTRRTALLELKKEAYEVGANAVIAVDLDYVELSASGNMVLLVASGTAVRIEE
ncbi:YbjQ family protein [Roseovarius sp. D22-M7]|uniref:YbjQ family protein n=1 Tax=Roseovarius sp. D22-M7 TaxID=3127116 RepID=UPI003FA7BFBA